MKVRDIFSFLNEKFPVTDAKDYDNVGILIGDPDDSVNGILVALDCTKETVDAAKNGNCNLIVTHHPVIFNPLKNILAGTAQYELIKNNISVISMHTNLDVGVNGINDCLAKIIGLKEIAPYLADDGYLLKGGVVAETNAKSLANSIKTAIGGCVKFVDGGKPITKVLVCSGSGGDFIDFAIFNKFDALVTADVKHHQFLTARDNGVSLFDAGHYNTEDIIVEPLKKMLQERFNTINFAAYHPNMINFA